jgi:hypothetical protein
VLDDLEAQQVVRALEPAAVEFSRKAHADLENERQRLDQHWQQRLQRARYEVELAERRYQAVDPSNRLLAASRERRWAEALGEHRHVQEDYDRFARATPRALTEAERARLAALAADLPALWSAPATTKAARKQIIRCLVAPVVVHVRCDSAVAGVTIHWIGGYHSEHAIIRPVATYARLRDLEPLMQRVHELRESGQTAPQIAEALNAEGFYPPKRSGAFTTPVVHPLRKRRGLIGNERLHHELLGRTEWWLTDLARELTMSHLKLRAWATRGWVHSRQTPVPGYWILWAAKDEVRRLRKLLAQSRRGVNSDSSELRTPKKRKGDK